jgi:cellulose synthase/poly-beta-1,6-N-acetylglucosamine synthase-like glycosyltransferase
LLLILFNKKSDLFKSPKLDENKDLPKVSIIVPAYNEGDSIEESIKSLKKIDWPKDKLQILIVNDGSTDDTSKIVRRCAKAKYFTFVDNKKNKGKAGCLNQGIRLSEGEFVACMDADSEVSPDILKKTIPYFKDEKVGATTVTVEVKKPRTLLQKIIEVEYIIGLSLALRALSFFNALHVTPGPFSIYRKSLFNEIGGFDENNITEDLEIAYRMQKKGYKIANSAATKVRTITPATFKPLYVQRKRWYTGSLATLWQHKDLLFNSKVGAFAFVVPYTFILVTSGLLLFFFSAYLGLSNLLESFTQFSLTNFNFFSYLSLSELDVLALNSLAFFGISAIAMTVIGAFLCLGIANKNVKTRVKGFVGFIFLFFLYQIFWATSFYSVLFGKKVKWR